MSPWFTSSITTPFVASPAESEAILNPSGTIILFSYLSLIVVGLFSSNTVPSSLACSIVVGFGFGMLLVFSSSTVTFPFFSIVTL